MCSDPSVAEKIYKIGVVSDTHGYFSPDLGRAFAGVKCILHAGDVGGEHVLKELSAVAPVIAVRGNMDNGPWAQDLPWQVETEICGARVLVRHIQEKMDSGDRGKDGISTVVVSGHTHSPEVATVGETLFLNPGSAGRGRHGSGRTAAILTLHEGKVDAQWFFLGAE